MSDKTAEQQPSTVTSSAKLARALDIATKASAGIICIRCPPTEIFRVVDSVYSCAVAAGSGFRLWSQIVGWAAFDQRNANDALLSSIIGEEDTFNPIKPSWVSRVLNYQVALEQLPPVRDDDKTYTGDRNPDFPDDCFYCMLDVHHNFDEPGFQAFIRRQSQRSYDLDQRLFLVIPDVAEIPDAIASFFHVIDYEYPTEDELQQLLVLMIEAIEDSDERPQLSEQELRQIALTGLGMTKTAFENAVALSLTDWFHDKPFDEYESVPTFAHLLKWVRDYKMEMLRKTEVLELQEPIPIDDIGGLQNYKQWMDVRKRTYEPAAVARGITPSRGVLVVGVPGTGKSLIAKAAGSQLGLPVVRFDIGRVFGSFIGQSEGRMRGVLKLLDALAPCVLMVDEIDKGFSGMASGGGNDSGTSARVFGTFLTWMQERKQQERPIFLVFTANRVQGLPPELMRSGRLDERFAVNAPNVQEREEVLRIHAAKRKLRINAGDMPALVAATDKLVGAEIEALVEQSLIHAYADGSDTLSVDAFLAERALLRPIAYAFKDNFDAILEWTSKHARPASADPAVEANAASTTPSRKGAVVKSRRAPPKRRLN